MCSCSCVSDQQLLVQLQLIFLCGNDILRVELLCGRLSNRQQFLIFLRKAEESRLDGFAEALVICRDRLPARLRSERRKERGGRAWDNGSKGKEAMQAKVWGRGPEKGGGERMAIRPQRLRDNERDRERERGEESFSVYWFLIFMLLYFFQLAISHPSQCTREMYEMNTRLVQPHSPVGVWLYQARLHVVWASNLHCRVGLHGQLHGVLVFFDETINFLQCL